MALLLLLLSMGCDSCLGPDLEPDEDAGDGVDEVSSDRVMSDVVLRPLVASTLLLFIGVECVPCVYHCHRACALLPGPLVFPFVISFFV